MGATHIWWKTTNYTRTGHITPTNKGRKPRIQKIVRTLLYYAIAVDPTMMVAFGSVSDKQYKRNETTARYIKQIFITVPHIQMLQKDTSKST